MKKHKSMLVIFVCIIFTQYFASLMLILLKPFLNIAQLYIYKKDKLYMLVDLMIILYILCFMGELDYMIHNHKQKWAKH